jgi:hypothetical protein
VATMRVRAIVSALVSAVPPMAQARV